MIKITKNGVPHKEFFSIYNAIEFLQKELFDHDSPEEIYPADLFAEFKMGDDRYRLDVEFSDQMSQFIKWVESFVFESEIKDEPTVSGIEVRK